MGTLDLVEFPTSKLRSHRKSPLPPVNSFALRNKPKCKFCMFLTIFSILLCLLWTNLSESGYFSCGHLIGCAPFLDIEEQLDNNERGTAKEETTCRIPQLPIMPAYLRKNWLPVPLDNCDHLQLVIERTPVDDAARILPNMTGPCCVQEVRRGHDDKEYSLSKCLKLQPGSKLPKNLEAMFVTCDGSMNAVANVPLNKSAAKLKYWERIPAQDRPISVFIFGFDSVSRLHAHRSLPKSLAAMQRMGFVDFSGYHSVAPATLTNFMALLMGMTRPEVRETCSKDWDSPFDDCPFVWKQFHESNYVTGYFEDGSQSFNWGGQSGFVKSPVDYYLHPLFLALNKHRSEENGIFRSRNVDCMSKETIPEFLLHHSQRFVKTFSSIPFFGFTWWAYPFHEDFYALADFDSKLVQLLELMESEKEIMERTMLIFISDHGDRTSFFSSNTVESYIERSLPPLFIRMPDKLRRSHPQMQESLQRNSVQFVTPFDLHHTMLHILSLTNYSFTSERSKSLKKAEKIPNKFNATISDRSSLLANVPVNRACESTHVPMAFCMCNLDYDNSSDTNKVSQILERRIGPSTLQFAINKLNQRVQRSKYKEVCELWYARRRDILYTKVVGQRGNSVDIVLAFAAWPGDARFEARMKIELRENKNLVRLIGFARINRYGDQSWCVGRTSDSDKEMREMCMCKHQKPS